MVTLSNSQVAGANVLPCEEENGRAVAVEILLQLFKSLPGLQRLLELLQRSVEDANVQVGLLEERMLHVEAAVLHLRGQDVGEDLGDDSQQFDALLWSATSARLQHLSVQQLNLEEELVDQYLLVPVEESDDFPHLLDHRVGLAVGFDLAECDAILLIKFADI